MSLASFFGVNGFLAVVGGDEHARMVGVAALWWAVLKLADGANAEFDLGALTLAQRVVAVKHSGVLKLIDGAISGSQRVRGLSVLDPIAGAGVVNAGHEVGIGARWRGDGSDVSGLIDEIFVFAEARHRESRCNQDHQECFHTYILPMPLALWVVF